MAENFGVKLSGDVFYNQIRSTDLGSPQMEEAWDLVCAGHDNVEKAYECAKGFRKALRAGKVDGFPGFDKVAVEQRIVKVNITEEVVDVARPIHPEGERMDS